MLRPLREEYAFLVIFCDCSIDLQPFAGDSIIGVSAKYRCAIL